MKVTIDTDELKAAAEVIFDGCLQLLSLIDGKENARLRFLDELKKNGNGKIIAFPSANKGVQTNTSDNKGQRVSLKFTDKEIDTLPKKLKTRFYAGGLKLYAIRRTDTGIWEIRKQISGVKFYASGKNRAEAKRRFIERLQEHYLLQEIMRSEPEPPKPEPPKQNFCGYMLQYFQTVKLPYVKANTYEYYLQVYRLQIQPFFGNKSITDITRQDCQELINQITATGKYRTAAKVKQILAAVLECAVQDGIIEKSPMTRVVLPQYDTEHGQAITLEEEKSFVSNCLANISEPKYQAVLFILYTGIRRSELANAVIGENFVTVNNAKVRQGKRQTTRQIPITPMLRKYLQLITPQAFQVSNDLISRTVNKLLPNHHCHELRHTFISRCKECGVLSEVVSVWAGHSLGNTVTATVYTHYSPEFMLKEAEKVKY